MTLISQRIKKYNSDLLPDMVQLKYKMMAENAYRFFRGTCHLFYEDLSQAEALPESPLTWVCGDLHLENFGSFKATNRLVHFDLNDFDESILAPATWELVRILTSIFVAFNSLKIDPKRAYKMAQLFLKTYSCTLAGGKAYYIESKTAKGIVRTFLRKVSKRKKKMLLDKRTRLYNNRLTIAMDDSRHFEVDASLRRKLNHFITDWIIYNNDGPYNYEVRDVVFRLAGTGSVGLKRYVFLLQSVKLPEKYLLIDMKQARSSALTPYVSAPQPEWETEAHRVVAVQRRMQNIPPALLSPGMFEGEPYLIQEMQPTKDSINFKQLKDEYRDIYQVIDDMAMLTASAQLRSSGRQGSAIADELMVFGESNEWQGAIFNYAMEYAGKIKDEYAGFVKDYKSGYFK